MKKNILPILLAGFFLVSCGQGEVPSGPTLESISVGGDYKTQYNIGESFDEDHLVVTAHYNDATTAVVEKGQYVLTGFDSSMAGPCTVTVTYQKKYADFTVTILPKAAVVGDITINVTVSGIEKYEGDHTTIWMNSALAGLDNDGHWKVAPLTQDDNNQNLWSISFENVTLDKVYEYRLVYGGDTEATINWSEGKNVVDEADYEKNAFLTTVENQTTYNVEATFVVKVVDGEIDVDFAINAVIVRSAGAQEETLSETTYVWAWVQGLGETLFTKNEDGYYHHTIKVGFTAGSGYVNLTPVLSNSETYISHEWAYQYGAWEDNGTGDYIFQKWSAYKVELTSEDTSYVFKATFSDEPEAASEIPDTTYYLIGSFNMWNTTDTSYQFVRNTAVDYPEYTLENFVLLEKGEVKAFTIGESIQYFGVSSTYDGCGYVEVTSEGNAVVEAGTYSITFWPDSTAGNHLRFVAQAEEELHVTFTLTLDEEPANTPSLVISSQWYDNSASWYELTKVEAGTYTITYKPTASTFYFSFATWVSGESNRYIAKEEWNAWSLTITDETAPVSVNVSATSFNNTFVAGVVGELVNCTLA